MMNRFVIFLFFSSAFTMTACSPEKSGNSSKPYALVSIYNVSPDASDLNMFVNGNNVAASVPFGSYTLYAQVEPGMAALKAQTVHNKIAADTSFTIAENKYYSLFLTDSLASLKPVIIPDTFGNFDSGFASVRFLNFSLALPKIDIYAFKDSTYKGVIWSNRSFADDITTDSINTFKQIKEGTYTFYVIAAGSRDTLARFTNKTFTDSTDYTLMLEGSAARGDTALQLGLRKHP